MKKTLCVIIAVIIAFSSFAIVSYAAAPDISMEADKTNAKAGDVVTVTVRVAKNSNLCVATLDLVYDNEFFKLVSFTATEAMDATLNENFDKNKARYVGVLEDRLRGEATLFTAQLEVLKRGGKISLEAKEVYHIADSQRKEVTNEVNESLKNKTVTITCPHDEKTTDVTNPTCSVEGKKVETCKECGSKTETAIEKLPHDATEVIVKEATCEENGKKVEQCKNCDYEGKETEIPATGHNEGLWVIVKIPTTKEAGLEEKKCTVCGKVLESKEIPMILVYKLGDVNEDGHITAADARMVLRSVAGLVELNSAQKLAADTNKDGGIGSSDARLILQYVVGKVNF